MSEEVAIVLPDALLAHIDAMDSLYGEDREERIFWLIQKGCIEQFERKTLEGARHD